MKIFVPKENTQLVQVEGCKSGVDEADFVPLFNLKKLSLHFMYSQLFALKSRMTVGPSSFGVCTLLMKKC